MLSALIIHLLSIVFAFALGIAGYVVSIYCKRFSFADVASGFHDLVEHFTIDEVNFASRKRTKQLNIILSAAGAISLVNIINVMIVTLLLVKTAEQINVLLWAVTISIMAAFHCVEVQSLTSERITISKANKKIRRIIRNVTIFGAIWGLAGTMFISDVATDDSIIVMIALIGTAAGGAAAMAVLPPAAMLFVATIGGPAILQILAFDNSNAPLLAGYACTFIFVLGAVCSGMYNVVINDDVHFDPKTTKRLPETGQPDRSVVKPTPVATNNKHTA